MLLVTGLIDGVFENLTSWDDIQKLYPEPDGAEINLKRAALEAHGPTANAYRIGSANYNVYKAAERAYSSARSRYVKTAFAQELKDFFERNQSSGGQEHPDESAPEEKFDDSVKIDSDEAIPNTFDEMTMPDFSNEHETVAIMTSS